MLNKMKTTWHLMVQLQYHLNRSGYVDSQVVKDALSELSGDSDDITEGSTNLFFTNAEQDARITKRKSH